MAAINGAGKRRVADEGGEWADAHEQAGDVQDGQQEEVTEAPAGHDAGGQRSQAAGRQGFRRPEPPPAARDAGVQPRRRRWTRRAAAPAAAGSVGVVAIPTVGVGFGFHGKACNIQREREREL